MYVGIRGGVDLVTKYAQSSRIKAVDGYVYSVSACDNLIYALVYVRIGSWTVRVYNSDYQLNRSWKHNDRLTLSNQLVVRKDSVLVPDRNSKNIIQYSLTGEVERHIPCRVLKSALTWLSVTSTLCNTVIVSCGDTVSSIDVGTGQCVWSTGSLERPTAVCCDDADRVYVAVGGKSNTINIAVLDGRTGSGVVPLSEL